MGRFLLWILAGQLSALLCLAHTDEEVALTDDSRMYQREIELSLPMGLLQEQVPPIIQSDVGMSPRGRRPTSQCDGGKSCPSAGLVDSLGSQLISFPPARPNHSNIGNICKKNRPKTVYGSHNLPQSGSAHLYRQGRAINGLEEELTRCCQQNDKLKCADDAWKDAMWNFCESEFTVKTRHYHCCKKQGSEREDCFRSEAPNPSYTFPAALQDIGSADVPSLASSRRAKPCQSPKCQDNTNSKYQLSDLSFPPGEPKSSNIQNICKLRKLRPLYTDNLLPHSGHGHYVRRAKSINRMESEFKKCCKSDNVACAHNGWQKVLAKFCAKEQEVKTKPHECCKKRDQASMYSCFASEAPFPEYDKEVESLNLSNVTEDVLQKVCGESKLLSKQKQIPLLVASLKESCCSLSQDKKVTCGEEQKEKFIATLCGPKKDSWKDTQNCCGMGDLEREECFTYYLQSVSLAVTHRIKAE